MKALFAICLLLGLSACSGEPESVQTVQQALEEATSRQLNSSEVAELLETADILCQLDSSVLEDVWSELDESQLAFQDFVFSNECPNRIEEYQVATGRTPDPN